MSLKKGTSLGHYETLGILGAGGMGEVYRARDTKLGREVAIKVLPADVASDPLRLARLEREARVLASLGHPHIATLYGYETAGTTRFLVMELVDGKTLLERLRRGPLPLAEALQAGAQIAAALDRAHRRGIVHRDLKPANVMLTRDGVKVLDFGLAKPLAPVTVDGEGPTMAIAMTQPGSFVGTLPYMAPEQLEGKVVDTRADIFALGVLLYEMITGRRPFDGANQASLIAAILTTQPAPIAQHVAAAPEGLDWLVQRCLAADPEERWQAANDIRLHLQRIAATRAAGGAGATGEDASGAVAGAATGSWRTALGWVAAAALALVLAMLVLSPDGPGTADLEGGSRRPLQRLLIDPGAAVVDAAVLSSDGTKLAYLAGDTPYALDVYVHSLASLQPRLLEGTRGAEVLAFSPDGAALAFTTAGELYKIAVAGGTPESLATNVMPWSISWQEDGFLYYSSEDRLWRVPQGSGEAQPLGVADAARDADYDARLLPQTRTLLFGTVSWSAPHPDNRDLVLLDLDGGRSRSLSITGVTGRFMPPRFLLFSRGRVIYGTSLDPASGQLGSPPRALEFEVQRTPRYVAEIALFDTSASGDLAFVLDESADMKELVWVERDGTPRPVTSDRRDYALASLAPDGATLAVRVGEREGGEALWMLDLRTLAWQRPQPRTGRQAGTLACAQCDWSAGVWTPDSRYLTLPSDHAGTVNLVHQDADFRGAAEPLVPGPGGQIPWDWSPDGRFLLFADGRKPGLWVYDRESGQTTPPADGEPHVRGVRFHPGGQWIAYTIHPVEYRSTAASHIWIRPFPGPGAPRQVGTERGYGPQWSAAGDELFYHGDTHIMAVPVQDQGDQLGTGQAVPLFEDRYVRHDMVGIGSFAVDPDGRFLMVRDGSGAPRPRIVIVQNFRTRLEELFPRRD